MGKYIIEGAEQGEDQDDRRMNAYTAGLACEAGAYMAGLGTSVPDTDDQGEEEGDTSPARAQRRRARRMEY